MSTAGEAHPSSGGLSPGVRRRLALASVLRSFVTSAAILVGYFTLPFSSRLVTRTLVELGLGLLVVSALLTWQVRQIIRSPYPGVRAAGALMVSVPLFLTVFATTYFLMGESGPSTFSEPMTRLDSMYLTVTIFATVGFGDITAVSQAGRAVVTLQMVGDLVLVGLIARVIVGAVQEGLRRRGDPRVE